jgi:hypothetical protein
VALALAVTTAVSAAQTREWTETAPRLQEGESSGIAVTSRGGLFLAPRITRLGAAEGSPREAYVWSVASDTAGNVYLGTGPDGRILRLTPGGSQREVYAVAEPMVTALVVLPGGEILAGTAPEGRVYRIRPDGSGEVWAETGERYVWALAARPDGTVFAGTGERGRVMKIDRAGEAQTFFDSDEPHIVSLVMRDDRALLAGGAGRGLIYEVDAEGNAYVLHDDDLPEVRALSVLDGGAIVAALLGPPETERRPPAVQIQLPDGTMVGAAPESVGELEDRPGPTVRGTIEGLELPTEEKPGRVRGKIVRIETDGSVAQIWESATEAPYCLSLDPSGGVVFGTGEPGRLYRVGDDDEVALLATLVEAQITGLLRAGPTLVAATSNPAGAYRSEWETPETGVFVSRPYDAGGPARWGSIRWRVRGRGGRFEVYTRTGNSADPDATWSGWGPTLIDPSGSVIVNPDGRFLQWRVRLVGPESRDVTLSEVTVSYVPLNRPPVLADFRVRDQVRAVAGEAVFRWNALDPDGDPVEVRVEYRSPGTPEWVTAHEETTGKTDGPGTSTWRAGEGRWDTAEVSEGLYEIRATASDVAANHPGEGREEASRTTLVLHVDRTPPVIEASRLDGGAVEISVVDALSPLSRLEVMGGDRVLFLARPVDGVCDSPRETFRIDPEEPGATVRPTSLRAVDRAGNTAEQPLP